MECIIYMVMLCNRVRFKLQSNVTSQFENNVQTFWQTRTKANVFSVEIEKSSAGNRTNVRWGISENIFRKLALINLTGSR